jgi:hypothetical protein
MKATELDLLQERYTDVTNQITSLKKAQKVLKKQGTDAGLRLKGSKFVKDKEVFGVFFDLAYYSHFDGHRSGAVYEYASGAFESDNKTFDLLKKAVETGDLGEEEELLELLQDIPFDDCGYYEIPSNESDKRSKERFLNGLSMDDDNSITWAYKGGGRDGEYSNGSGFTIRLTTQSEIKKVKWTDYTETN